MGNYKININLISKILMTNNFEIKFNTNVLMINGLESAEIKPDYRIEWNKNLEKFLKPELLTTVSIDKDSCILKNLISMVQENNSNSNPIINYTMYKALCSVVSLTTSLTLTLTLTRTNIIQSEILFHIPINILKILIGRIGTSIEDKNDQQILLLGKIDRSGKSSTDAVDDDNEGYLVRIINILSCLYGCFEKINEIKFKIHTHSKVYKYWLEQIELVKRTNMNIKTDINTKSKSNVIKKAFSNKVCKFINTELWEHQKKISQMILDGINNFGQKGWGDASNVGSGKTLTGLSVIEGLSLKDFENLKQNKVPLENLNYLILVPNTNLYSVWENEIKSHCDQSNIIYYLQNPNGSWVNSSNIFNDNIFNDNVLNDNNFITKIYISTMGRNRDHSLTIPINFVIVDECLSIQNNHTKWTIKAFEQVVKSKYGVLMLSATFFRTRFDKLFFMLKMLQIELPTKIDYLDTILNIAIGANIKTKQTQWDTTTHKIELENNFYEEYNKCKKKNKNESYVELKKYMRNNIDWEEIIITKTNELVKKGRKVLIFTESESQLERLGYLLDKKKIKNTWSFYPDITNDICVITKSKGTWGINNLIKYDTIVTKPPEPDKLPQMKGRLDRPGQIASKLYLEYIMISDTIDEIDLVSLQMANNFYSSHIIPLANYYDKYT